MSETTKELAARLRAEDQRQQRAFMEWGFTAEEVEQHEREDAEYLALRQLEFQTIAHQGEQLLAADRIEERMRQRDDAFVPASRFYQGD